MPGKYAPPESDTQSIADAKYFPDAFFSMVVGTLGEQKLPSCEPVYRSSATLA